MARWRLGIVGLLLAVTACGTGTGTSTRSPGAAASPTAGSTPVAVPADCGSGIARDVDSALRIIRDGADCPGSTNRFWRAQLGDRWTDAKIISYDDGDIPASKCGEGGTAADFADNAFYCPLDDVVAYSNQLMARLYREGGPYLPVVVLQHELGHRANKIDGQVGVVSRSEENQADCEAGATTRFAYNAKRLPGSDALRSAKLLFELGDVSNFGDETANDPDAHGTPPQRVAAYARGYFQGITICDDLGRNPTGHTL
jgi:predicted metalloprotease